MGQFPQEALIQPNLQLLHRINKVKEDIMTKKWWQSKALILGVLVLVGGIADYIAGLPLGISVPTIVAGIAQLVIRFLTNTTLVK